MKSPTEATFKHNKKIGRYLLPLKYPEIPLHRGDLYITTTVGDRLDSLANTFYKDPRHWWVISNANPDIINRGSYALEAGIEIRIPVNISKIITKFEQSNK